MRFRLRPAQGDTGLTPGRLGRFIEFRQDLYR